NYWRTLLNFFFKQNTAYGMATLLEFRRVLFRSWAPGEGIRAETPSNPGPAPNVVGGYMMGVGYSKLGPGATISTARNFAQLSGRSEERRVGKECRVWGAA